MKEIIDNLIKLAEKRKEIYAIYKGKDPEEGFPVYYFLHNERFDDNRSDTIGDLELRLYEKFNLNINLAEWPVSPDKIKDYPFLGTSLWEREKSN